MLAHLLIGLAVGGVVYTVVPDVEFSIGTGVLIGAWLGLQAGDVRREWQQSDAGQAAGGELPRGYRCGELAITAVLIMAVFVVAFWPH